MSKIKRNSPSLALAVIPAKITTPLEANIAKAIKNASPFVDLRVNRTEGILAAIKYLRVEEGIMPVIGDKKYASRTHAMLVRVNDSNANKVGWVKRTGKALKKWLFYRHFSNKSLTVINSIS